MTGESTESVKVPDTYTCQLVRVACMSIVNSSTLSIPEHVYSVNVYLHVPNSIRFYKFREENLREIKHFHYMFMT